jgi:hypothetical protein
MLPTIISMQINANYAYKVRVSDDWDFRPAIEVGLDSNHLRFKIYY